MYTNDEFKNNIVENGKQISVQLKYDNIILEKNSIISCTKTFKGDMFKSIMQYVDVEIEGMHELKDKEVSISFGVKYDKENYNYIDWGTYIVDNESIDQSIDQKSTKFTAYDYLYKSHIVYDLHVDYPLSMRDYLLQICNRLGYELVTASFINEHQMMAEEKYGEGYEVTFRDILDEIAGVSGGVIHVMNNQLFVKYPETTGYVIDEHNIKNLTLSEQYGPINSLVLSEEPQSDVLYREDSELIETYGRTEVKLSNNEIMKKSREIFIDNIFNKIKGMSFYPFDLESFGFCFFEPYDSITIKGLDGQLYNCLILSDCISVTKGVKEVLGCSMPQSNETDYSKATQKDKLLYKTLLSVDKQKQEINGLVEKQEGINSQVTSMNLSLDGIKNMVKKVEETLVSIKNYFIPLAQIKPIISDDSMNNYEINNDSLKLFAVEVGTFEFYNKENFINGFSKETHYSTALDMSLVGNDEDDSVDTIIVHLTVGNKTSDFHVTQENTRFVIEDFEFSNNETYLLTVDNPHTTVLIYKMDLIEGNTYQESKTGLQEISTQVNQTGNTIEFVRNGLNQILDDLDNYVLQKELKEYIRFDGAEITLGRSDSTFSTVITNTKMSFFDGSTEVAYISNNSLYIEDAVINHSLTIGSFSWRPRHNGNLSLLKVK